MKTSRVVSAAVVIAMFVTPALAQGQGTFESRPASFWRAFEAQTANSFASSIEDVKNSQLENVITISTLYRNHVDFSESVPAIIAYHKGATNPYHRALAVAALQSIDSWEARSYLRRKVKDEDMEAARNVMIAVLSTYTSDDPVATL